MKKIIVFLFLLIIFSCKKENKEIIEYDKEGKIVSKIYGDSKKSIDSIIYYNNNVIDTKIYFNKNNTDTCFVKYFDGKGELFSEGFTVNKIKYGKWKYYDSKNKIRKIVEFKNICGEEYPNQEWNYNPDGILNKNFSTYYTSSFEKSKIIDGVKVNDLKIYYTPMNKKGADCKLYFSPEIESTFCNSDKLEMYSINSNKSFVFTIPLKTEDIGNNHFKGYIEENLYINSNKKGAINFKTRRIYFEIILKTIKS
jgi:antitoxin component YwqK of YwqJK toxin-antitoxin module